MSFEPVLFDSTMLETANEAFLFCRACLEEKGHVDAVRPLKGLDPINTHLMGRLALRALLVTRPLVSGEVREYVDIAVNAMERAIGVRPLRAVA